MHRMGIGDAIGWTVVAGAVGTLLLQVVGTPNRPVSVLQALTPWWLLPTAVVAVAAVFAEHHRLAATSALTGIGLVVLALPLVLAGGGPGPSGPERLVVMASNVLYSNERIADLAAAIGEIDPDVVALSEVTPAIAEQLRRQPLADVYPHRIEDTAELASGLLVWSKYPLTEARGVTALRRSIDTAVESPIGTIRVVLVHPPPPVFNHDVWSDEIRALPDVTEASTLPTVMPTVMPTVVLGDFNASWFHPPFRRAVDRAGLRDALAASGRGLTMTWPTDTFLPAFVTLDHVLVDDRLAVVDADLVEPPGSDHAAVVATLAEAASG